MRKSPFLLGAEIRLDRASLSLSFKIFSLEVSIKAANIIKNLS